MKLVAIYATPKDIEIFEKAYYETHMPLMEKVPGLENVEISQLTRVLVGHKAPYLIVTMTFTDNDALKAAMKSPEMAAAGENLDSFAKGQYTLCFAD